MGEGRGWSRAEGHVPKRGVVTGGVVVLPFDPPRQRFFAGHAP